MNLEVIAGWIGLEPTPDRLDRLALALPVLTGTAAAIAEAEGIDEEDVPGYEPRELPAGHRLAPPQTGELTGRGVVAGRLVVTTPHAQEAR